MVTNLENIFSYLCASRNRTQVEQMDVFAIKPYIKHILTLSNVHNRQYYRHKSVDGVDFLKLSNCGSPSGVHTSDILVNQWPFERIFCVLLDGKVKFSLHSWFSVVCDF